jgi:hypothetical protein
MDDENTNKINKIKQFGFYSKGIVYALIGILAAMVAAGLGGDLKGPTGLVSFLDNLPAGRILVAIVALGLFAYSVWCFYASIYDPNENGANNRIRIRLVYAYSGVIYSLIAFSFGKAAFTTANPSEGSSEKAALNELLTEEWGVWAIGIIAIAMAGNALWQIYLAYCGEYMALVDDDPKGKKELMLLKRSGKYGYLARGVVFAVLAFFMLKVFLNRNEEDYKGTAGAFAYLLNLEYGPFLMGIVALGMIGYGVFCILVARHSNLTKLVQ